MNQFWQTLHHVILHFEEALDDYPNGPTRVNVGFEINASQWGQLRINAYGFPFSKQGA
jgi:hypothetical protein